MDKRIRRKQKGPAKQLVFATSIHEAAHFVLGYILCASNYQHEISILKVGDALGHVNGEDLSGYEKPTRKDIENEIISLYAGYFAELLICGKKKSVAKHGAQSDFEKANDLLKYIKRTSSRKIVLKTRLEDKTRRLVSKYRPAIEALSNELRKSKTISGDEAMLIVDASLGNREAKLSLMNLKSLKG